MCHIRERICVRNCLVEVRLRLHWIWSESCKTKTNQGWNPLSVWHMMLNSVIIDHQCEVGANNNLGGCSLNFPQSLRTFGTESLPWNYFHHELLHRAVDREGGDDLNRRRSTLHLCPLHVRGKSLWTNFWASKVIHNQKGLGLRPCEDVHNGVRGETRKVPEVSCSTSNLHICYLPKLCKLWNVDSRSFIALLMCQPSWHVHPFLGRIRAYQGAEPKECS